jgi:hypothetical protein
MGIEPTLRILQTLALPLGYAVRKKSAETDFMREDY